MIVNRHSFQYEVFDLLPGIIYNHGIYSNYRILSNYGAKNNNLRLALALTLERKNYTPTSSGASIRVALSKWNVPYKTNGVFYLVSATL